MEIDIKSLKSQSKLKLLSYTNVTEEYTKVLLALEDAAQSGYTDCNYYKDDDIDDVTYFNIIKILELDGFKITKFFNPLEDNFIVISWGN